jgi:hypothetical protein
MLTAILPHPADLDRRRLAMRSRGDHLVDRRWIESIRFYSETLGMSLKFRSGAHSAARDGGPVTLALATAVDHRIPGQVVVGIKTADVDAAAKRDGLTT